MVAGFPEIVADAPLDGGVNVTEPPATGSIGLFALTVAISGSANAPLAVWPPPEVAEIVNPPDSKAPMSTAPTRGMPRSSTVGAPVLVPASMAGLPGRRAKVSAVPP